MSSMTTKIWSVTAATKSSRKPIPTTTALFATMEISISVKLAMTRESHALATMTCLKDGWAA